MKPNIGYKLLTQDMTSHGRTKWEIGVPKTAQAGGTEMCTNQVLHYYTHPLVAVFANPIHAAIEKPRIFEIEVSECVASDSLKSACKTQTLLRELQLPELTDLQCQFVAIKAAMLLPSIGNPWTSWAQKWLSGEDRSSGSENRAYAHACARARAYARAHAHAHAYAQAQAQAHAHAHACAHAYAHAHAHARAYACACACAPTNQIIHFLEESLTNPTLQ